MSSGGRPGSGGEHDLQQRWGTAKRANAFYDNQVLDHLTPAMPESPDVKKTPERWVVVTIDEAYIHCSKHIPMLQPAAADAETGRRAGDVFKAKSHPRAWLEERIACSPEPVIGEVTFSAPETSPSGRRLPLPARK